MVLVNSSTRLWSVTVHHVIMRIADARLSEQHRGMLMLQLGDILEDARDIELKLGLE